MKVYIPRKYIKKTVTLHGTITSRYERVKISDAVEMLISHLGLEYVDGETKEPRLSKRG
jgi:hypothetical protein